MDRYKEGMLAKSRAGHDKDHIYVIKDVDDAYVYLVDGEIRTLDRPKKKKKMHVQLILEQYEMSGIDNVGIKRILKGFDKESRRK